MARDRSPNYPAISLPEAISRAEMCRSQIGLASALRPVIAKALGYGSLNGSALSALSAMLKYGLLEKHGLSCKISSRAISILNPTHQREKAQAIWDAATTPNLFVDLMDTFPGIVPEESAITGYLSRRGFANAALNNVSQAFRETFALVLAEAHGHTPPISNAAGKSPVKRVSAVAHVPLEIAPQLEADKMRVTVTETGVEVNAEIKTGEGIDRLIRALEATRPLVDSQKGSSKEEPGHGQPRLNSNTLESRVVEPTQKAGGT
jgi:hypothetical protein